MEKLKVGKIYKIIDNTNGNVYIGSTTQQLNKRLSEHKSYYNRYLNGKGNNCTSFDIIKNNDYRIELIKFVIYKDRIELHQRERYYIENNNCINKNIPLRTDKEYYIDNKESKKQYYIDNKEYIKEYNKIKYECECGSSICQYQKEKHFKSLKHINFISLVNNSGIHQVHKEEHEN
jgi:hypothetical protein